MPVVPSSIQALAISAIALQASKPLNGVDGLQLAERLKSGTIDDRDVEKMHRFFVVNTRNVGFDEQALRTSETSPLLRSWECHGGHAAKVWVERLIKDRKYEAYASAPITELFTLSPDQIYDKFSLGAWRYEYGLNPTKAARFVEEYQRATGFFLDYKRAFGDASEAVLASMYRRIVPRSPALVIAECLQSDDPVMRVAAELDAEDLNLSDIDESIYPKVANIDPKAAAKIVWAPFVAFAILAVESPKLLEPLIAETAKPPRLDQHPKPFVSYSDAVNTYITYFHPKGNRFVDPATSEDFEGIDQEVFDFIRKAYFGIPQTAVNVKKLLGKMRRWTAENGFAGSLFHVFNADWGKGNWQHILENIPMDSDVHPAFSAFVAQDATPSLSYKIIQTVSDKAVKDIVLNTIAKRRSVDVTDITAVPVSSTAMAAAAESKETPLSVYALVQKDGKNLGYLGAWSVKGNVYHVFDMLPYDKETDPDALTLVNDSSASLSVKQDELKVLQLHADMPGTAFNVAKATEPLPTPASPSQDKSGVSEPPQIPTVNAVVDKDGPTVSAGTTSEKQPVSGFVDNAIYKAVGNTATLWFYYRGGEYWGLIRKGATEASATVTQYYTGEISSEFEKLYKISLLGALLLPLSIDEVRSVLVKDGVLVQKKDTLYLGANEVSIKIAGSGATLRPVLNPVETAPIESIPSASPIPEKVVSYNPPKQAHLVSADDGVSDPEMFGTLEALSNLTPVKINPATKSMHPSFKFDLGDIIATPGSKRILVGYGVSEGVAVYVFKVGTILYHDTTYNLNTLTVTKVGVDQATIDALIPLPGSNAAPKLNYKLCDAGKKVARDYGITFKAAPSFKYHPGAYLLHANNKVRLLGWAVSSAGTLMPLVQTNPDAPETDAVATLFVSADSLANASLYYETPFNFDAETGEIDVSKQSDAPDVFISGPVYGTFVDIGPSDVTLDDPDAVKEPPLGAIPSGKHLSAGILMVIPGSGSILVATLGSDGTSYKTAQAKPNEHWVVLYRPLGDYGGYKMAIPKGTVEAGEPMLKAAVREVREETGLVAKPLRWLGDYRANTSVVRLYIGLPVKGNLAQKKPKHEECDAILLRKLVIPADAVVKVPDASGTLKFSYLDTQKVQSANPWIKKLIPASGSTWQVNALMDAATRLADDASAMFVPEQAASVLPVAKQLDQEPALKDSDAPDVPYSVSDSLVKQLSKLLGFWYPDKAWKFLDDTVTTTIGYPSVGSDATYTNPSDHVSWDLKLMAYAMVDTPDASTPTVLAVARPLKGTLNQEPTLIPLYVVAGTSAQKIFVPPESFKLLDSQKADVLQGKTYQGPVTPTVKAGKNVFSNFWKQFAYSCPYPITIPALNALIDLCALYAEDGFEVTEVLGMTEMTWTGAKEGNLSVPYGSMVAIGDSGATGHVVGYVNIAFDKGPANNFAVVNVFGKTADSFRVMPITTPVSILSQDPQGTALFTHPDPKINALIIAFANGEVKLSTSEMKNYCKAAGVPSWNLVKSQLASPAAAMFDPATPKLVALNTLDALKSLHKLTKMGAVETTQDSGPPQPLAASVALDNLSNAPIPSWDSQDVWETIKDADPSKFAMTGSKVAGGSKPNAILSGYGKKWFFKWADGEAWRAEVDRAASILCSKVVDTTVPVGVLSKDGHYGSIQPLLEGASPVPELASSLTDAQKSALLAQHVMDMFIGDHDGHAGNWLMVDGGRMVPVDRGQAFKPLFNGTADSLDPYWHMPGNFGQGYAKRLLIDWAEHKAEIPAVCWMGMASAIEGVMALKMPEIEKVLGPVFDALKTKADAKKKLLASIEARKDSCAKDWTTVLSKLRSDFKWPKPPNQPMVNDIAALPGDPMHGIAKAHANVIKEAANAPVRGKVLKMDTHAIENQDVLITPVWIKKGTDLVEGTLLRWRINREAQNKTVSSLMDPEKHPDVQIISNVGSKLLAIDVQLTDSVWQPIHAAIKSVNYHFGAKVEGGKDVGDGKYNVVTISKVLGPLDGNGKHDSTKQCTKLILSDLLKSIKTGSYKGTDNPEHVKAMCQAYLDYCAVIASYANADNKTALIGSKTSIPQRYEPPAAFKEKKKESKVPYAIKLETSGAVIPSIREVASANGGRLIVNDLVPMYNATGQPIATIKMDNVHIQIALTSLGHSASVNKGYDGLSWALIESPANPATVAKVMRIVEVATGISTKPATSEDKEIAFLATQLVTHTSPTGIVVPNAYGEVGEQGVLKEIKDLYKDGKIKDAIELGRTALADALGVSVKSMLADKNYNPEGQYPNGSGFPEHVRLGLTIDRIKKVLGADVAVCHGLTGGRTIKTLLKATINSGMLLSTNQRPFYGIPLSGETGSQSSDIRSGGSQGLFAVFRKDRGQQNHLYFDLSIMLRPDVYIVGKSNQNSNFDSFDSYGSVVNNRHVTPESWLSAIKATGSSSKGVVGPSSKPQINIRHSIDLRKYLIQAPCSTAESAKECIELVKSAGWVFADGRTPESIFVVAD